MEKDTIIEKLKGLVTELNIDTQVYDYHGNAIGRNAFVEDLLNKARTEINLVILDLKSEVKHE